MYKDMEAILQDRKAGDFELSHFSIESNDLYALLHGMPNGKYIRLTHRGSVVMSDTGMEKRTNSAFCRKAHGKVLIGGLGIGLILLAVQDKEDVEHIIVIEKNQEVIDLVADQLPLNDKVEIVNGDVFDYVPQDKYNTIYMDIWNFINSDVYEKQMKPLMSRYRKYLVKKTEDAERYIDCWCRNEAKKNIRL